MNNHMMMNNSATTTTTTTTNTQPSQRSSPPSSSTSSPLTPLNMMNGMVMFNDNSMPPPSSSVASPSNSNNLFSTLQFIAANNPSNSTVQLLKQVQHLPPNQQQQYLNRILFQLNNQLKTINTTQAMQMGTTTTTPNTMNNNSNTATTTTQPNNVMTPNTNLTSSPPINSLINNNTTPTIVIPNNNNIVMEQQMSNINMMNNSSGPNGIINLVQGNSIVTTPTSTPTGNNSNGTIGVATTNPLVKNNSGNRLFDLTMFSNQSPTNAKNPLLQNLSNDILLSLYQQQVQSQHPFNHGDKFLFENQTFEYQVESLDDLLKIGIGRWKNLIQTNLVNQQQQQQQQQQQTLISVNGGVNIPMNNVIIASNNMSINSMNNNIMNGMNGNIITTATNQPVYVAPGNSAFQKYMKDSLHGSVQYFPQRQVDGSVKMNE